MRRDIDQHCPSSIQSQMKPSWIFDNRKHEMQLVFDSLCFKLNLLLTTCLVIMYGCKFKKLIDRVNINTSIQLQNINVNFLRALKFV